MQHQFWKDESLVLLIGNVDHEGVVSNLFLAGRRYKKKVLHSKPSNWQTIVDLFAEHPISTVLVKLTQLSYVHLARAEYKEVSETLLEQIATVPHVAFVYEGLFAGETEDEDSEWAEYYGELNNDTRLTVNAKLAEHSLNVVTYKRNSEVTVLAQQFLNQSESGLLLRLYVPNSQLWSNETDRLLQLFRDYLTRIASLNVRLDETRTRSGVIYELHGDSERNVTLSSEFEEFSHFMNLCVVHPDQAELILHDKNIATSEVMQIMMRYAKEAKRLQVDMRQEREQKVLQIRHRLESELLDELPANADLSALGELVDATVPTVLGPRTPLLIADAQSATAQSLTINVNPQFVDTLNGIIAQEISGDIAINDNDRELLRLFAEYAGEQHADLVSALRELNDESAPTPGRLTAKQKIKRFLLAVGSKATDVGVGMLQSYIEKKMLGI